MEGELPRSLLLEGKTPIRIPINQSVVARLDSGITS